MAPWTKSWLCPLQDTSRPEDCHSLGTLQVVFHPIVKTVEPPASSHRTTPASDSRTRVLVVDDHPVFRSGIRALLSHDRFEICGEAEDARAAMSAMRKLQPDVVLVDISLPGTNGIELVKSMLAESPKLLIVVISMHDESLYGLRALRAGARGYVTKHETLDHIVDALDKVVGGGIYVSPEFTDRLVFKAI